MAENVTPVTLEVKDFAAREVLLVDYKFNQATDREGQISGIPRGGRVNIRVKAMNDGNAELLGWMLAPTDPRDFSVKFKNTIDGKGSTRSTGQTVRSTTRTSRSYARSSRTAPSPSRILGNRREPIRCEASSE